MTFLLKKYENWYGMLGTKAYYMASHIDSGIEIKFITTESQNIARSTNWFFEYCEEIEQIKSEKASNNDQ